MHENLHFSMNSGMNAREPEAVSEVVKEQSCCSECGDELAGGIGGRCLACDPLHSLDCRCDECTDDHDAAYNAFVDGEVRP